VTLVVFEAILSSPFFALLFYDICTYIAILYYTIFVHTCFKIDSLKKKSHFTFTKLKLSYKKQKELLSLIFIHGQQDLITFSLMPSKDI